MDEEIGLKRLSNVAKVTRYYVIKIWYLNLDPCGFRAHALNHEINCVWSVLELLSDSSMVLKHEFMFLCPM